MKTTVLAFAASILAVACSSTVTQGSGNAGGSSLALSPSDFCRNICTRVNACDNARDVDTCAQECTNSLASIYPKLRSDLVSGVETCWQKKDCKNVLLSSSALDSCADEADESLAPTSAGTAFCDGLDGAWTKCGESLDKSKCLHLAKQYNDDALGSAKHCLDKACADIDPCVASALGLDDSSSSSPGSSSSSSSSSGGGGGPTPP
jgi:hypothetical protein